LAGFLETETTNPKMLEFIKTKEFNFTYVLSKEILLTGIQFIGLDLRFDHRHCFAILFKHKHNPEVVAAAKSSLIILF
jgi:NHS family xanthosine MFS transporter